MEDTQSAKNSVLFIELILSLSSIAMQHIGKTSDPLTGKIERNFKQAQTTIDMIVMLKEKTKGNLSKQESDVLNTALSNLQLNYVDELEKK